MLAVMIVGSCLFLFFTFYFIYIYLCVCVCQCVCVCVCVCVKHLNVFIFSCDIYISPQLSTQCFNISNVY